MLKLKSIERWLEDDYLEEKIEERRKKKKKNCQAHVTVLRTCSMSYGGLYKTIIFHMGGYTKLLSLVCPSQ